jgi:thiamine pyrophosphokinase
MKTVALMLAGSPPSDKLMTTLRQRSLDLHLGHVVPVQAVIAADGAGDYCLQADLIPDLLTGDLDSISPTGLQQMRERTLVKENPDQNSSDLAKGLEEAAAMGAEHVTLLGYCGGRTDHLLSILAAVGVNDFPRSITLLDDDETIHHLRPGEYSFATPTAVTISLITFSREGSRVTLRGTRYPADDLLLLPGTRGVSNLTVEQSVSVTVLSNDLFLVITEMDAE